MLPTPTGIVMSRFVGRKLKLAMLVLLMLWWAAMAHAQPAIHYTDSFYRLVQYPEAKNRFVKHEQVLACIPKAVAYARIDTLGYSVEGRPIVAFRYGTGATKLLVWSQMHGNEATGTLALLDLMNWFDQDTLAVRFRNELFKQLSIVLVPMLNPDGASRYNRRTTMAVDINRDAVAQQAVETQILANLLLSEAPAFAISLHDQYLFLGNPETRRPASISFLAAYANANREVNTARETALKMIVNLAEQAEQWVPGGVTRYADAYIPTAFEEFCIGHNIPMLLIETGGFSSDPDKLHQRMVNFRLLLSAMSALVRKTWMLENPEKYYDIPVSEDIGYDILIRNAEFDNGSGTTLGDIGIRHNERYYDNYQKAYREYFVADMGSLDYAFGYREIDATGMQLKLGKIYSENLNSLNELNRLNTDSLLALGVTAFRFKTKIPAFVSNQQDVLCVDMHGATLTGLNVSAVPNFVLRRDKTVVYVVVNGKVRRLHQR